MTIKIYKQEIAGYIILSLMILASIYCMYWSLFSNVQQNNFILLGTICFLIYFIVLLANYAKTKIIVANFFITYETLFKTKQVAFTEILKIKTFAKIQNISHQGQIHRKYILALHSQSDVLEIKIKQFSRKSLKDLTRILIDKCPKAEIDKQTYLMTEGKMPSLFFKNH